MAAIRSKTIESKRIQAAEQKEAREIKNFQDPKSMLQPQHQHEYAKYVEMKNLPMEILTAKANKGNAHAQTMLGIAFGDGKGVTQNSQLMVAWLQKAADQNHSYAMANLGNAYMTGSRIPKDVILGSYHLMQAAKLGNPHAQYALGRLYRDNADYLNLQKSVEWFSKAADQNHAAGQCCLAIAYCKGEGIAQNIESAVELFYKSAKKGMHSSILYLWTRTIVSTPKPARIPAECFYLGVLFAGKQIPVINLSELHHFPMLSKASFQNIDKKIQTDFDSLALNNPELFLTLLEKIPAPERGEAVSRLGTDARKLIESLENTKLLKEKISTVTTLPPGIASIIADAAGRFIPQEENEIKPAYNNYTENLWKDLNKFVDAKPTEAEETAAFDVLDIIVSLQDEFNQGPANRDAYYKGMVSLRELIKTKAELLDNASKGSRLHAAPSEFSRRCETAYKNLSKGDQDLIQKIDNEHKPRHQPRAK